MYDPDGIVSILRATKHKALNHLEYYNKMEMWTYEDATKVECLVDIVKDIMCAKLSMHDLMNFQLSPNERY